MTHNVSELLKTGLQRVGLHWQDFGESSQAAYGDPSSLVGGACRFRCVGWKPAIGFPELIESMVDAYCRL